MFPTTDLTISLDSELASLLADYDAFVVAEDALVAGAPGVDGAVVAADPILLDPTVTAGEPDAPVDPVDPPAPDAPVPDLTATAPPATDAVDPAPVDGASDPADAFGDPGLDAAPVDFFLAPDELAFDLHEAAFVGRRIGGEFLDFA